MSRALTSSEGHLWLHATRSVGSPNKENSETLINDFRGAWLALWVERVPLDLGVVGSSPTLGVDMTSK